MHRSLAVEAEVGIGKTFAYLVPALMQYRNEHCQIVIATSTIALQEQLYKDAKAALRMLNIEVPILLEFGMTNVPEAEQQDAIEKRVLADMVTALFLRLVAFIEDRYSQENRRMQVDSKLRRMIRKKKMELGMKEEPSHSQSI